MPEELPPNVRDLPLLARVEMALRRAAARVIEEHRRAGDPLVYWRDGKVILVPPDQVTPPTLDGDPSAPTPIPPCGENGS